jgi:SAM-dependent methyltransferase
MNSYEALAGAYDGLMQDGLYQKRADYLERQLRRSAIPVRSVLDLACGTGTIACMLTQKGYIVTATDGSEEMLTEAARKAADLDVDQPPFFLHQSMPRLRLAEPVDAVVSTLDSLNYLTRPADVQETFRRVGKYLKPKGLFIFDINSPYKLRRMDGQMYTDETEDSFCLWRTFFSERTRICTYCVDLFRLGRDGAWHRSYEEHRERAWEEADLRMWLAEAGFSRVKVTGDLKMSPPRPEEDRLIFHCVRDG